MVENSLIVSIVVCTYNRAEILQEALQSLTNQTTNTKKFEIIIINNNSTDHTQKIAEQFAAENHNFRVIVENKQGLSHARNRGFLEAASTWVAYLDDDAKVNNKYIERMLFVISNYNFDCFGGVYLPWYKFGKPKWFKDSYGSNGFKLKKTGILENDYASGGVIVFKKDVLEHFDGFDYKIGMTGEKIAYGEETLLQVKMRKEGFVIGFDPELRIEHIVSQAKLSPLWFIKSAYAVGRDYWISFDIRKTKIILVKIILGVLYHFFINSFRYSYRLSKKNYYIQNWFIDIFKPVALGLGQILGTIIK